MATGGEHWPAKLRGGELFVSALEFSPDGKTLAVAYGVSETAIQLWDLETNSQVDTLEGHHAIITDLAFSPDGSTLISSSADQTISIWDLTALPGKNIDFLSGHGAEIWRVQMMPDDVTLYGGFKDGTVARWEMSREPQRRRESPITIGQVARWRFSQDSRSLLVVELGGRVVRRFGQRFEESETLLELDGDTFVSHELRANLISATADYVARTTYDGDVRVWNRAEGAWTHQLEGPDGQRIIPMQFVDDHPGPGRARRAKQSRQERISLRNRMATAFHRSSRVPVPTPVFVPGDSWNVEGQKNFSKKKQNHSAPLLLKRGETDH